jgi:hypothetical protein
MPHCAFPNYANTFCVFRKTVFNLTSLSLRIPCLDQLVRNDVKQGLTYMAIDTRNNELMGVSIGGICKSEMMIQCVPKLVPICLFGKVYEYM